MDKLEILDQVLHFCDVQGDYFDWRSEPLRSRLFGIFEQSQYGAEVCAAEIHDHVHERMDARCRWNVPMQERVAAICAAWEDWEFAVQRHRGMATSA